MTPRFQSISERIRARRERLGLSQRELALAVGTSQASITAWETGTIPRGGNFIGLATALKVSLDWLRAGEGPEEKEALGDGVIFRHVYLLLEEVIASLSYSISPEIRLEIFSTLFSDADKYGLHVITKDKIISLLKIANMNNSKQQRMP